MGEVYIKAHQGHDLRNRSFAATCLKHYIGYSFPTNGEDRTAALIPEIELREHFLPPFEAGVAAGCLTVMLNSGKYISKRKFNDSIKSNSCIFRRS
jgi:beta-glucosidase